MDDVNLAYVAKSLADANKLAERAQEHPFTHVILYGDFEHTDAARLKDLVEEAFVGKINVSSISSPWKRVPAGRISGDVDKLWEKFRDFDFDYVPLQVKALAIWTALCERYGPRVCVIGHRSGFVEGAGFIGIPIFYLNNERKKIGKGNHPAGDLLWRTVKPENQNRLRELADVMNTFIPIEALKADDPGKALHVEEEYKHELTAALFMYMCCDLGSGWTVDHKKWGLWPGQNPAWIVRVDVMHDKCKDPMRIECEGSMHVECIDPVDDRCRVGAEEGKNKGKCEVAGHEVVVHERGQVCQDMQHFENVTLPQTGQEWLRRRYLFAIRELQGQATPKLRLSGWTGLTTGKWTSASAEDQDSMQMEMEDMKRRMEVREMKIEEMKMEIEKTKVEDMEMKKMKTTMEKMKTTIEAIRTVIENMEEMEIGQMKNKMDGMVTVMDLTSMSMQKIQKNIDMIKMNTEMANTKV